MTDTLDKQFQDLAVQMLTEFGETTTFKRGRRIRDNITGTIKGTETDYNLLTVQTDFEEDDIDGTLILRGDVTLIASATGEEPIQSDRVTIDGDLWNVLAVRKLRSKPNGRVAAYELLCRV